MEAAIAARTALNGREILGSEVGSVKIGYAKVPVRGTTGSVSGDHEGPSRPTSAASHRDGGDHVLDSLRTMKGSSAVTMENVSNIENYGSNLVIDLINKGTMDNVRSMKMGSPQDDQSDIGSSVSQRFNTTQPEVAGVSEEQMIMMVLCQGDNNIEDIIAAGSEC